MSNTCTTCTKNTPECPYKHRAWSLDKGFYPSKTDPDIKYCDHKKNCLYHREIQLTIDEIIRGLEIDIHNFFPASEKDWAILILSKKQAIEKLKEIKDEIGKDDINGI